MRTWLVGLLLLPTPAAALPVFDNGVTASQLVNGDVVASDTNGGTPVQRIADDFQFAASTSVGGIQFVGGYFPGNTPEPESFVLQFYTDAGGLPGAALGTAIALTTARTDTGFDWDNGFLDPFDLFTFSAPFAPVLFGPGTYWFSVTATTPPGGDDFVLVALQGTGTMADSLDRGATWRQLNESLAFVLLPEPGFALAMLAAVALASRLRSSN